MNRLRKIIAIITIIIAILKLPHPARPTQAGPLTLTEKLELPQPIHTESRFGTKLESVVQELAQKVVYKDDPESEIGEEKVVEQGSDGRKIQVIKITYYEKEEYSREIVSAEVVESKDKVISRGSKIVWRILQTPAGEIRYWKKLRVQATHYDSRCPGCDDYTAIGLKTGKGVIAVDPAVIKLRSQVYIPGYGQAIAGDTGGAIKGNIIDLGFDDAKTAGWSARYVDIYLTNKVPN